MLAGIDTHKDTLAVAVIDQAGRPVVVTEVTNTEVGFDALEDLLTKHQVTRVGIEGSGNYGRGAAVRLVLAGGLEVVEVPPSLTARERSGRPGAGRSRGRSRNTGTARRFPAGSGTAAWPSSRGAAATRRRQSPPPAESKTRYPPAARSHGAWP